MDLKNRLSELALAGMTMAYGLSLIGIPAAKRHDVTGYRNSMMVACDQVCVWLVAYVTKQWLVGRDRFVGTVKQYWFLFMSVLHVPIDLAMTTIGLEIINMGVGLRKLRNETGVGAMVGGISRHCLDETF